MTTFNLPLNRITIETGMWAIFRTLMQKHGTDIAHQDFAPLEWYVNTGRASVEFIRLLLGAKPFMIARKLHQGGSYDDVIARLKQYLGY